MLSFAKPQNLGLRSTPRFEDIRLNCGVGYVGKIGIHYDVPMTSSTVGKFWHNLAQNASNLTYSKFIKLSNSGVRILIIIFLQ